MSVLENMRDRVLEAWFDGTIFRCCVWTNRRALEVYLRAHFMGKLPN